MDQINGRVAQDLAEEIRQTCLEISLAAYERGGLSGLCAQGRWDLAVDAMRSLDTERLVDDWLAARSD